METERLRALVTRAAEAVKDAPADLRPSLAAEVLRQLVGGEGESRSMRVKARTSDGPARPALLEAPETLGERLAGLGDASHPDRLTAIAAYFFELGEDVLTAERFREAYSQVRVPPPQNLSANLGRCQRRGWLVPAVASEGVSGWRVTQAGIRHVRALLEGREG